MKRIKSKKITDSARGEECTMQFPGVCCHNHETVVFAHSNEPFHGKAMGRKAHDLFGAYLCSSCHALYDGGTNTHGIEQADIADSFRRAMAKTQLKLIEKGIIKL